jgi:hypothetical protein
MSFGRAFSVVLVVTGCGGQRTSTQTPGTITPSTPPPAATSAADTGPALEGGVVTPATTGTTADSLPVSIATARAHSTGNHYVLDVKAPGSVNVGGHGELEVVLVAKDGFHINDEFPYKLKTASAPAGIISFDASELSRAQGAYTKTEARFQAKFSASRAGAAKIGGTMALSVCTKKECITDKVELEVPVTVR